ncbi:hypothetical protein Sjap_018871 [Stephania japonica]|uniref:starch synthase n=1 Tax=Stephania japonica TaxID=461633 RepID=A0AAP0I8Q7_9MAGN
MEAILTLSASITVYSHNNQFCKLGKATRRDVQSLVVQCSRKDEKINGLISETSQTGSEKDDGTGILQSTNKGVEMTHNDIWKLFREAQQNILYLNKQRLMAIEELKKTQLEKQLLIDRLEHLEVEQQDTAIKSPMSEFNNPSVCGELLLRIDSMVLTGIIDVKEASDFRSFLVQNKVSIGDVFSRIHEKSDIELLAEIRYFFDRSKRNRFHIVHICAEMAPVVSVGPLGSYVTGLSNALQKKGDLVEVILPKYASSNLDEVKGLRKIDAEFFSYFNGHWHGNRVWTGVVCDVGVTFIEPLQYSFFSREMIYGYPDDYERFTYFSRASLDYILKSGKQPDVLHIHNWETAIVGPLFWDIYVDKGLESTRILFSCHEFSSQCLEHPDKLTLCGLDPSRLHRHDRLQDNTKKHLVNILKGGVVYSNEVVIMSSIHSKGKIIRGSSHGLEPTLAIHKEKISVAPYGFDSSVWNSSTDKFLPANYSADDLRGKAICKVALQQRFSLSGQTSAVVVGCICAEITVTDLENLKAAIWLANRKGAQFVCIGTNNLSSVNAALESFQKEIKGDSVRFIDTHDEALSHLVLAGSDIMLCTSFHDPTMQIPFKAIKYGSAPVALTLSKDEFSGHSRDPDFKTTWTSQYILSAFGNMSLSQAIDQIRKTSDWKLKMRDGMAKDFSWDSECLDVHLDAYTSIKSL